jgi:hypothetical protein
MTGSLEALPLGELRARRAELNAAEDEVSYTRRVAQTRVDLVRRRLADDGVPLADALRDVLDHQAMSASPRPPRDTSAHETSPRAQELDTLCARYGFSRLDELDGDELERLASEIEGFEQRISGERRRLFDEIDALTEELVRRYREGDADVDGLWSPETAPGDEAASDG